MARGVPFKPGNSYGKGRKPKAETIQGRLEALFTKKEIDAALEADFRAGDREVRKFVYEHYFGKPVNRNENKTELTFPESINIVFKQSLTKEKT